MTLNTKQKRAISALVEGTGVEDAAHLAGVHRGTVSRWLSEPEFWHALQSASDAALNATSARLGLNAEHALEAILVALEDGSAPHGVRLRAADLWLNHALRFKETLDFATRLDEVEARLAELDK